LSLRKTDCLDIRAYSEQLYKLNPVIAEHIAWYVAKHCAEDDKISKRILELTGMVLAMTKEGQQDSSRAVFVSFLGGILVSEGLAYPNTRLGIGFRCPMTDLAAPTPL